jgi:hypothetical protein
MPPPRSSARLKAKIEVARRSRAGGDPKSRASRRVVELGSRTLAVLEEQWRSTAYHSDDDLLFGHPTKGTPLETGKLAKRYLTPALARVGIEKPFLPLPRPPTHLAATCRRGRQPSDLRPGKSWSLAGLDLRALHARCPGSSSQEPPRRVRRACSVSSTASREESR